MFKRFKKTLAIGLVLKVLILIMLVSTIHADSKSIFYEEMVANYMHQISYKNYLLAQDTTRRPKMDYVIDAVDYSSVLDMEVTLLNNPYGIEGQALLTEEEGLISYTFEVVEAGFYNLALEYFPVQGKRSAILRGVLINGELPYSEAHTFEFNRYFADSETPFKRDNQGNDLKPSQIEAPQWTVKALKDFQGYESEPLLFYLKSGLNEVSLVSRREPMLLKSIRVYQEEPLVSYEEALKRWKGQGYEEVQGKLLKIDGQHAAKKSSQMLYPIADNSSPAVTPYEVVEIRINTMGGYNWRMVGQWIEWEVDVPHKGLYELGLHVKQSFIKGVATICALEINGKIPFSEVGSIPFPYDRTWVMKQLGETTPYLFPLDAGINTIRLEVVLGDVGAIIQEAEIGIRNLNSIYRSILSVTGSSPDRYRDYQIRRNLPQLESQLKAEKDRLDQILEDLTKISGDIGDREAGLLTLRDQLKAILKDLELTPRHLNQLKQNIASLGDWMIQAVEQPLQIDSLFIKSTDQNFPKTNNSFWHRLIHELKKLFFSFFINYNAIGNVSNENSERTIDVWVGTGRDQANIIKSLIDEDFTKETGINVNLMLVDMATLLPATISGQGPDVALQVGNDLPMNYGMRSAVVDLSRFETLDQVKKQFYPSAMVPYTFEGSVYALPEQQTFNMLFYRRDILDELGLEVPKTWSDVKIALSVLSKNQMQFGMLPSAYWAGMVGMPPVSEVMFGMFLYQFGGEFYTEGAKASALDTEVAINAFKEFTEYYTDYGLEREFDIVNRFRTGEMPLIIADYTTYNILQVSAPEIRGLWGFQGVPGVVDKDGSLRSDVASSGSACVMMEQSEDKEASWTFMQWWVSATTQAQFGREMEGLMGPAARYPTANREAFSMLPWPSKDYKALSKQFEHVRGIPQVPGGYFTARHINNAFYTVVVGKEIGPRDALVDYVRYINDEIAYKRREFALDVD